MQLEKYFLRKAVTVAITITTDQVLVQAKAGPTTRHQQELMNHLQAVVLHPVLPHLHPDLLQVVYQDLPAEATNL